MELLACRRRDAAPVAAERVLGRRRARARVDAGVPIWVRERESEDDGGVLAGRKQAAEVGRWMCVWWGEVMAWLGGGLVG